GVAKLAARREEVAGVQRQITLLFEDNALDGKRIIRVARVARLQAHATRAKAAVALQRVLLVDFPRRVEAKIGRKQ
nr:hypothetical protein [Tanacetum cinerariifolium]